MKKNNIILIPIIILFLISIFYLPSNLKYKQIIWCILGLIIYFVIKRVKFKKILKYSLIYYFIGIFLLALVLILGKFTNGSRGW